ncbi:MAG: GyrI-like domain-containing protein [Candidatus Izemoplasma sp.]
MKYIIKNYPERYYLGIEHLGGITIGKPNSITKTWKDFFDNDLNFIEDIKDGGKFVGLECYPIDFLETKQLDYFVLCEVKSVIHKEGFISKKIPAGKYICFSINYNDIPKEIVKVHQHIKENDIKVSYSFDYEEYLSSQDYTKKGSILNFCLKLIN